MKKILPALFFAGVFIIHVFGEPLYILKTGHTGAVTVLDYQQPFDALVSAGSDGMVKVWDRETLKILYAERIGTEEIRLLALHPKKPYYAVVSEKSGNYNVTVSDWKRDKKLYSISLADKPLYLAFSPQGNYLAVSVENWRSLYFFNAETGTALDRFSSGFGIVTYLVFSSKETAIMTYQPLGKIIYWEFPRVTKMKEVATLSGIIPVGMTEGKRHLIGFRNDSVIFLDALSGSQSGSLTLPGLIFARGDQEGIRIVSYERQWENTGTICFYSISGTTLVKQSRADFQSKTTVSSMVIVAELVYAGDSDGEILKKENNRLEKIVGDNLSDISDIALSENQLAVGTPDSVVVLTGDYFTAENSLPPGPIRFSLIKSPYPGTPVGLGFQDRNVLYIWSLEGQPGAFSRLAVDSLRMKSNITSFQSNLVRFSINHERAISIEQSGLCQVMSLDNGFISFHYAINGLNAAAFISPTKIVFGKSRLSSYESTLVIVDTGTGETKLLPESAAIVHDLIFDDTTETLYYIGFEEDHGKSQTVVKSRTGKSLSNVKTVSKRDGEIVSSSIALDREKNRLFFSFGENQIYVWNGSSVEELESSDYFVKKIYYSGGLLYALNDNSTVTAWDPDTKKIVFQFFLFADLSWAVVTGDGSYFGEGDVSRFFSLSEGDSSDETDLLKRYRLEVTITNRVKDSP